MNRCVTTVNTARSTTLSAVVLLLLAATGLSGCATPTGVEAKEDPIQARLRNFDDLDFNVFTHQKWDELPRSHSRDIIVHWPDGRVTRGIESHIADLKWLFAWAPDSRIKEHPVKFGQVEWTAAISVMEGTFSKPMSTFDGKLIPPTSKPYKITLCTLGHWKGDVMDEEYLYWDNFELMKQIGLAKDATP